MAKKRNSKIKNTRKEVNKKINKMESPVENDWYNILKIVFVVVVVLAAFYLLTVAIVGKDEKVEDTTIQYREILAGSSFDMGDAEYLVVYYDKSNEEYSDLASTVYNYSYRTDALRVYTVDMSDGFNKPYTTVEGSKKDVQSADQLLINGPTLIKFKDGAIVDYVEGVDGVKEYLK